MYNTALKRKWDNQSILDYAVNTVREEERAKAEAEKRTSALILKKQGVPASDIAMALGLTIAEVESL